MWRGQLRNCAYLFLDLPAPPSTHTHTHTRGGEGAAVGDTPTGNQRPSTAWSRPRRPVLAGVEELRDPLR
ncbi:hypothetical protein E2C01_079133 [Portunus trituberculatus]|uniref:Uncharacterized protein n=1 Tax=Portunus trituberculatus TaxID=210409 RepID=A0A5B7IPG9_PORTR|nr:hypothetical protein [Portunus trituberculatus]